MRGGSGLREPGRELQSGQGAALAQPSLGLSAAGLRERTHPARLIHALPYEALVGAGLAEEQGQELGPRGVPGHRLLCCGVKAGGTHSSLWEMLGWRRVSGSLALLMPCAYKSGSASGVMAGSSPACVQSPHNPMLLQVEEGGSLERCPWAAASA